MKPLVPLSLLTLGALAVAPAEAQERRRVAVAEQIDPFTLLAGRRVLLGVNLDLDAVENDSVGATILSVTRNSPADRAGLRAGDIITRLNGRSLVRSTRDRGEDHDPEESLAAIRLVELMSDIEPGDTVRLEYRRGDVTRTVSVATAKGNEEFLKRGVVFPDLEPGSRGIRLKSMPGMALGGEPGFFSFRIGGPLARIEFAPMNDDLGQYFGTSEGVLVVDAPRDNLFGLRGGDVVLSVDGRPAKSPMTLHKILASYEDGEVVKLEIMRNRSRQTVSSKIEREDEAKMFKRERLREREPEREQEQ